MFKLKNLKWIIDQLSEAELEDRCIFYDPYFERFIQIETMDHVVLPDLVGGVKVLALIGTVRNRK